ncbi:MAG: glycosyltransferase family 2 protein [Bacteroidetes bacterium]|nr:MAG: glycosyltransferase family 2 protein [Bacteroidota bacterium]
MKKVAVVILNYNGKKFLSKFLPLVIEHTAKDAEIWVADNNSLDGSIDVMQEEFPGIKLVENPYNGGFATGYNLALKQIEADYYVLLNSDIEVTENWINPVIELMESDPMIAACQPKILDYNKQSDFEYAGAAGGFIDKYGYPFCRGRIFQSLEKDEGQYNDPMEVFWASGACMFVRANVYHKFGGLDDDFFAHMEEIDFCWRVKSEGYKIMFCPSSKVYHVGGGTLPKKSPRKTYLNFRNNFSLLYKNLPSDRLLKTFVARLFLDGAAGIKFLLQGGFQDFVAVIEAHLYFYKNFKKLRKKRKELNQNPVSKIYKRNIAFDHYLHGKKKFSDLDKKEFS